jgi:myo-inositol-1(or 4)-monophosphatase
VSVALDVGTEEGQRALLAIALSAAREAATLVATGWRGRFRIDHKGPVDLVTEFDRASETLLRERLHGETPFSVVGEEGGVDTEGSSREALWYVDPIDGTTNFVHGHPFYCVSVGLVVGDQPLLGAVVAPALHTEWTGIAGRFALRSDAPCTVSSVMEFTDALLATGFPYDRRTSSDNNFDAFVAIKTRCQAVRRCGSAALDLCLVADGTYDGYWERKLRPWDVAAGSALVLGAGGRLSTYEGDPFALPAGELTATLVATNGKIHDALVSELSAVRPR